MSSSGFFWNFVIPPKSASIAFYSTTLGGQSHLLLHRQYRCGKMERLLSPLRLLYEVTCMWICAMPSPFPSSLLPGGRAEFTYESSCSRLTFPGSLHHQLSLFSIVWSTSLCQWTSSHLLLNIIIFLLVQQNPSTSHRFPVPHLVSFWHLRLRFLMNLCLFPFFFFKQEKFILTLSATLYVILRAPQRRKDEFRGRNPAC